LDKISTKTSVPITLVSAASVEALSSSAASMPHAPARIASTTRSKTSASLETTATMIESAPPRVETTVAAIAAHRHGRVRLLDNVFSFL
jgi:hypothetical protein